MAAQQEPTFCRTSISDRVLDTLSLAQRNNWIVSIHGPPGVGKTTAAICYANEHPRQVWYYAARRDTSSKGPLFRDLAVRFTGFKNFQTRENIRSLILAAQDSLDGPVLLILDEAQNLNGDALETLRSIHDEGVLAIALVGNHTFTDRFNAERQSLVASPQFRSRLAMQVHLSAVATNDLATIARQYGIPQLFDEKLAKEARGFRGLRIVENVARLAGDLAGDDPPARGHFETAISALCT